MAPKWWISIRNIIIYLETKFRPNRRIFVFWWSFLVQNGRHMVQHVLLPVNIHFHWNLLIFEFLTIFLIVILAAILKILKTKSTPLSDNLFLCQVSKESAVRFEFNLFCTLVTMATAAILNFFQPHKSCHTLRWIFLQSFMKFDERNPIFSSIHLFCFHGNCGKVCPTDSDFFGLSRSTRCDPIKFHQFLFGE